MSSKLTSGTPIDSSITSTTSVQSQQKPSTDTKTTTQVTASTPETVQDTAVVQQTQKNGKLSKNQFKYILKQNLAKVLRYLIEGFVVAIAAFLMPSTSNLKTSDIVALGLISSATFAILDLYTPHGDSILANAARQGAGAGLGFQLSGFPGGFK